MLHDQHTSSTASTPRPRRWCGCSTGGNVGKALVRLAPVGRHESPGGRSRAVRRGARSGRPWPGLAGSRCANDGTVVFPAPGVLSALFGQRGAAVGCPTAGTLWSWTVQHFRPKAPFRHPGEGFVPYPSDTSTSAQVIVEAGCRCRRSPGCGSACRCGSPGCRPGRAGRRRAVTYAFAPDRRPRRDEPQSPASPSSGPASTPSAATKASPALDMAEIAIRAALADAGLGWDDIELAVGGSNVVRQAGLSRRPVSASPASRSPRSATVARPAGSRSSPAAQRVACRRGRGGGRWSASTTTRAARSTPTPPATGSASGTADRPDGDHAVLRDANPALPARARDLPDLTLAQVAARAFRNGGREPERLAAQPLTGSEVLAAPMVSPTR